VRAQFKIGRANQVANIFRPSSKSNSARGNSSNAGPEHIGVQVTVAAGVDLHHGHAQLAIRSA